MEAAAVGGVTCRGVARPQRHSTPPPPLPPRASAPLPLPLLAEALRSHDWSLEYAAAAGLALLAAAYWNGTRVNEGIAAAVAGALFDALSAQFLGVGIGADEAPTAGGGAKAATGLWLKEAPHAWSAWSSGRRHVWGALAELRLKPRQDVLGGVLATYAPQLVGAAPQSGDQLVLELPLRGTGGGADGAPAGFPNSDGFVLAIRPAVAKAGASVPGDVARFAGKVASGASLGIAAGLEAAVEHRDIAEAVLALPLRSAAGGRPLGASLLAEGSPTAAALRLLHVTDAPQLAGAAGGSAHAITTARMSTRVLRLVLDLPPNVDAPGSGAAAGVVGAWVAAACDLADGLASLRLTKAAAQRVAEAREEVARDRARRAAEEEAARKRAARAEAERAEKAKADAKLAALPREERRKAEIEERKRAMERQMPKMKMKRM
jgi:hypothetical protein